MLDPAIDADDFIQAVEPLLIAQNADALRAVLRKNWTRDQILSLLASDRCDVRKVAALALAFVGCIHCLTDLTQRLRDPDPVVSDMAEHAIWSIWFHLGSSRANCLLHRGAEAMEQQHHDDAIRLFTQALEDSPNFVEAWNQRATAKYLSERYENAIADATEAVARNPEHFGAWASLGYCYSHLGRFDQAMNAYQRAHAIYPRLHGLAETIAELNSGRTSVAHRPGTIAD